MALFSISNIYPFFKPITLRCCTIARLCISYPPFHFTADIWLLGDSILYWAEVYEGKEHPSLESPKQPGFRLVRNQRDVMDQVYTFTTTEGLISVTSNGCAHTSWGQ